MLRNRALLGFDYLLKFETFLRECRKISYIHIKCKKDESDSTKLMMPFQEK